MNAEDRIDRAKAKKRLGELLGNKSRSLEEANELIDILVGYVVQHGTSIIDIRDKMATQEGAIETLADMLAPQQEGLVGFDKPELIGIKGKTN
jgi:hypothetical protein